VLKPNNISEITTALENGAVLVLPTDTVYGLVCDATNSGAVEKIFEIKKREKSKPLAVFVKDIKMAKKYADISEKQENKLKESWPGAVTFILKAKGGVLASLVYKNGTVGVRVSNYNLIKNVFENFSKPIAQTSANISGQPALTKVREILEQLENKDILIIDSGDLPERSPSTIIDLTQNKDNIIRK